MHRRIVAVPAVLLAAVALIVAAVSVASAARSSAVPKTAKLQITGGTTVKVNKYIKDTQRFNPGTVEVKSGGKIKIDNRTKDEPHTISIVSKSQLPKAKNIFECAVCEELFTRHEATEDGPPGKPVLDDGEPGIDQAGDSWILNPGQDLTLGVSAAKGKTLYYMCAIHPWMQGRIKVG